MDKKLSKKNSEYKHIFIIRVYQIISSLLNDKVKYNWCLTFIFGQYDSIESKLGMYVV